MERDSFIFYKSFYDAVRDLPNDIKLEVLTSIMEYALYEIQPEKLKPFAAGMFSLIKPVIDKNNSRYKNGTKGGRKTKSDADVNHTSTNQQPDSNSFADETKQMKAATIWLEAICMQFNISADEAVNRLDRFQLHCETECSDKPHRNLSDAKRHFCSWMRKSYKWQQSDVQKPADYTYSGGFGSKDT